MEIGKHGGLEGRELLEWATKTKEENDKHERAERQAERDLKKALAEAEAEGKRLKHKQRKKKLRQN